MLCESDDYDGEYGKLNSGFSVSGRWISDTPISTLILSSMGFEPYPSFLLHKTKLYLDGAASHLRKYTNTRIVGQMQLGGAKVLENITFMRGVWEECD